ncbi:MAG: hypothetical protein JXR40_01540 [Pontiellaceae bacterium]|nr:hypothetical protein [Pontiellaceae bacterium]
MSLFLLGSSFADTLSDFENAVTSPKPEPPPSSGHSKGRDHDRRDRSFGSRLVSGVFGGTYRGVKWMTYDWWAGDNDDNEHLQYAEQSDDDGEYIGPGALAIIDGAEGLDEDDFPRLNHELGAPYLSYLRFDYRQQYLDSDLSAEDLLLEAGYKYGALYGRYTQYEGAADERLDIQQYYGMLRNNDFGEPSMDGIFSIGIGVGGYSIHGQQRHGGPALTVPIALYPTDWCGIEFRPSWARVSEKTISDYDISVSVGKKFAHLRLGYRWLWVQGNSYWLNGPYAGVTFSF